MRRRTERTCAMLTRFRRSPTSKAFAGSDGQIAGVIASAPFASESRIASVRIVPSSGGHHASIPEASSTNRLAALPFIDSLADREISQACSLSDFANQLFGSLGSASSLGTNLATGIPRSQIRIALETFFNNSLKCVSYN